MKPVERMHLQAKNLIAAMVVTAMLPLAGVTAGEASLAGEVSVAGEVSAPDGARSAELLHLLRHDCGSCHGLTLAGGLGPPLRATDLRDKPAQSIQQVILYGRPGSAMPGWRAFLSESEAAWLVEVLMRGLADED